MGVGNLCSCYHSKNILLHKEVLNTEWEDTILLDGDIVRHSLPQRLFWHDV